MKQSVVRAEMHTYLNITRKKQRANPNGKWNISGERERKTNHRKLICIKIMASLSPHIGIQHVKCFIIIVCIVWGRLWQLHGYQHYFLPRLRLIFSCFSGDRIQISLGPSHLCWSMAWDFLAKVFAVLDCWTLVSSRLPLVSWTKTSFNPSHTSLHRSPLTLDHLSPLSTIVPLAKSQR